MLKKYFLLVVALFASVTVMRAQTISADCTSACENCPVVLNVDGFAPSVTAIDWMKTTDGNTWTIVRTTTGNSGTFVDDMPNTAVSYKAKAKNGSQVSNIVTISLSTNSAAIKALPNIDCSKIKSYTAHLYKQEACVAVPGYTVAELPMLFAPTLEDLNGVDGNLTGTYMGRRENCTSEPPKEPTLFSKSISLNADFKTGTSYILWGFADPSNNISYCLQKIKVIDDKLPSLNCPANVDLGEIPADDGSCSLSLNSLLEKMQQDQKPTATDNCSATSSITPMMFYRKVGDVTWIKITDPDAYIFNVGVQYELDWRFYKKTASSTVDNTVYVDCPQIFKVVDKEAPDFDCESLQNIHVMPNNYRLWHNENAGYWSVEYEDFASGNGTSSEDSYEFTLKKYFNDKTLQMHGDVSDNCNGNVKVTVEIEDVDGERSVITSLSAFQKYEFQIGTSTIYYTFSDDAEPANSKTCKQTIVVEYQEAPVPDGGYSQKVVLNANDMGVATYPMDLSQVPTATIRYDKEVRYINDNTTNCNATYPDYDYLEIRKAMTGEREVKGYPHAVKLVKSDGSSELCENPYTNADTVQNKLVQHRKYAPERICKWDVISTLKLKRTNFASMPTCATTPLQLGTNKLIWYFENADGLESSYTTVIEVKDATVPSVVCGDWEKDLIIEAGGRSEMAASVVNLKKPSATDLSAADNCTTTSNLDISWKRTYESSTTQDLSAPFKVGTTNIEWIVRDETGNSSSCYQKVEVLDKVGPVFDCTSLVDLKLNADSDGEAKPNAVVAAGLIIPETAYDDEGSPTGSTIKGVGTRSDGKGVFADAYPLGTTTITWTFTDASNNKTTCMQNVIVDDKMPPVYANCNLMADVLVQLGKEECVASLEKVKSALGKHSAEDNLSGTIYGEPFLRLSDGSLTALLYSFTPKKYDIVWVFKDAYDNRTECNQVLEIRDVTSPDVSGICPNPKKEVSATGNCFVNYDDLNLPTITLDDPCDGIIYPDLVGNIVQHDGTENSYSNDDLKLIKYPVGVHTFKWIFADKAGNSNACEMEITVADKVPPVLEDDGNDVITVSTSEDNCTAKPADVKLLLVEPKAYDEYCNAEGNVVKDYLTPVVERWFNDSQIFDAIGNPVAWDLQDFPKGNTKLKWIFKDKAGNTVSCEKTVTVKDLINPVFEDCGSLKDITCLHKEGEPVSLSEIQKALGTQTANDNCSGAIAGVPKLKLNDETLADLPTSFTVGNTYTIVWVFEDEDGNTTQCNQKLILKNNLLEIETVADLETLCNGVNTGEEFNYKGVAVPAGGEGIFFKLTVDLDLGSVCGKDVKGSEVSWIPIGTDYAKCFKGYFDGCGHSISNLYINEPSMNVQGFFGYIVGANVKNLQLVGTDITANNNVGGLFGYANEKSSISNCANSGSVIGADNVGGICGVASGSVTIEKCTNSGSVKGEDLTGGIIGNIIASAIDNCVNSSSVKCTSSKAGGICGYDEAADIKNSYYDKQMCIVGGINSNYALGSAEGRLTSELTNGSLFNDPTSWVEAEGLYPRPAGIASTDAAIVAATPLFLHVDVADNTNYERANAVGTDFTVNADNGVIWSVDNMGGTATVDGNRVTLTKNGEVALILTKGLATKRIPLTITKKPIIADISAPSSVMHGDNLVLTIPTVNDYGTAATGRWEIESAGTYKTFDSPYTVRYADNGKRLRYVSENEYGTIYSNAVSITVTPKQLKATTPTVTATKPYDGTVNATITDVGTLENVVDGDVVSFKATATYENESIGVNKTITVTYEIDGADAGNYLTPVDYSIKTGEIIGKTEVGTISAPESVCSGNSLTLVEPNVNAWGLTFVGKWEMSGDNFATVTEYTGQVLKEEYDGWKLRYVAETNIGKEYSNEVKIEVNLDPSYIAKMWDDVLVCSNAKEIRFVSWQWYNNGTAIDGATKEYYSNPSIEAGYQVAATTADGHTYFSCPIKGSIKSQSISLKAYPNPSPASESLKIEIEGISEVMLQEATLVVFSTSGVQVMNLSSVSKINEIRLPQGIYVVMLCTGNRSISTKVIRR